MQFKIHALIAVLGSASSVLAAPQALVFSYNGPGCQGQVTTSSVFVPNSNVGCAVTLNPTTGGSTVIGSGCATYFYSDNACKTNFFGTGNVVPNSNCYTGVGSYSVKCPSS